VPGQVAGDDGGAGHLLLSVHHHPHLTIQPQQSYTQRSRDLPPNANLHYPEACPISSYFLPSDGSRQRDQRLYESGTGGLKDLYPSLELPALSGVSGSASPRSPIELTVSVARQIGSLWRYCRSSLLVLSLLPRCHGECGSQKNTGIFLAHHRGCCAPTGQAQGRPPDMPAMPDGDRVPQPRSSSAPLDRITRLINLPEHVLPSAKVYAVTCGHRKNCLQLRRFPTVR